MRLRFLGNIGCIALPPCPKAVAASGSVNAVLALRWSPFS